MRARTCTLFLLLSLTAIAPAAPRPRGHLPPRPIPNIGLGHTRPVTAIAWSPDGKTLATGAEDQTVVLWDSATWKPRATMAGYSAPIVCLAWSPDGKTLAGADNGTTAILWDATTGRRRAALSPMAYSTRVALDDGSPAAHQFTLVEHSDTDPIRTLAWSSNGRIVAGAEFPNVLLWDAKTGRRGAAIRVGDTSLLQWRPGGRILAVGGGPHREAMSLWDEAGRKRGAMTREGDRFIALAWSPDGRLIAAMDEGGAVLLWEWTTRRRRILLPRLEGPTYDEGWLAWSPDGSTLASSRQGAEDEVILWDPVTGKARAHLKVPELASSLVWSPDGRTLAVQAMQQIDLWDVASRKRRASLGPAAGPPAWRPDRKLIATGDLAGAVVVWDTRTGGRRAILTGDAAPVTRIVWRSTGREIAAATDEPELLPQSAGPSRGFVTIWDALIGRPRSRLIGLSATAERVSPGILNGLLRPIFIPPDRIYDLTWSPDGRTVATATGEFGKLVPDGTGFEWYWLRKAVMLWDPVTGRRRGTLPGALGQVIWSPDGKLLATGTEGSILLWDPGTILLVRKLPGAANAWQMAWSPDGKTLATPVFQENRLACYLWDTATWELRAALSVPGHWYPRVAWSANGSLLATAADDRQVFVWDGATSKLLQTLVPHATGRLSGETASDPGEALLTWSPDGRALATASTKGSLVKVWNGETGHLLAVLTGPASAVVALQWSPRDSTFAAAYADHTVILWDPATCKRRAILRGHTGPTTALAWSPDGRLLATGSEDGSLRLWDGATGKERVALHSLDGGTEWLAITPEGYFAASAHGAAVIQWRQGGKLWPLAKFRRRFERPDFVRKALTKQPAR
jgi:WD40 repeat protein